MKRRPKGCYWDYYYSDKIYIANVTCENCPVHPDICDWKQIPLLKKMAESMRK